MGTARPPEQGPGEFRCARADEQVITTILQPVTNILWGTPNRRIAVFAFLVYILDQTTKWLVVRHIPEDSHRVVIDGFFRLVHWGNTGAAWSLLKGNNDLLAVIALAALLILFLSHHHFESSTLPGQVAFGMIFGGIVGNLTDRLLPSRQHVVDFLYFYVNRSDGSELGFPAFNVADSAICVGVGLVFYVTWKADRAEKAAGKGQELVESP